MDIDVVEIIDEGATRLPGSRLEGDARWELVQRIVQSPGMRRAMHLRKILLYVTETSLLRPDAVIREHDIAQGVLGRKEDFDPAYDTIVRVQVGHLRQKLQAYFESEGAGETLRLTLPKGSYLPRFEAAMTTLAAAVDEPMGFPAAQVLPLPETQPEEVHAENHRWLWVGGLVGVICLMAGLSWWKQHRYVATEDASTAQMMFAYLAKGGGKVAVVLPDTSLLLIQKTLHTEIPLEAYTQTSNRKNPQFQSDNEPLQTALHLLGDVRTTTLDEASVAMDFMQALPRAGLQSELRYARDLHIRDFGRGSYILIGNLRSDPWVTLFAGRNNFQFVGKPVGVHYEFHNVHPATGEEDTYVPVDSPLESTNYADIVLTPNLTDSGYVMIVMGSDVPANEAAARFLMGGELPPALSAVMRKGNLRSLEILLRGHHLHAESNDTIAVVAYRVTNR